MYQNLKGTDKRPQRQREADAQCEQWAAVKMAAGAIGVVNHAEAIAEQMSERIGAALWLIDNWREAAPPTPHEIVAARAQQLRAELTEALGGYERYLDWANQLTVDQHLDRGRFCEAAELELEALWQDRDHADLLDTQAGAIF